jgi:hypothetical protein
MNMRRFRYSLRGLLLVATLLAISFSLIRTCMSHYPDEPEDWQWICFCVGVHLLVCTVGGAAGYLVGARRGAKIGVALSVPLLWVVSLLAGVFVLLVTRR